MKLILNPTKPVYWNKNRKIIRFGNFPDTGKEVGYEDETFVRILQKLINFIDRSELENIAINDFLIKKEDFDSVINYLLNEKCIITESEYNLLFFSERYNRQDMYFYMLSDEMKKLEKFKNKKILVLGLGGIGSIVTELLARAGFENFNIIDCDKVEISNLTRQTAYYSTDIGKLKTDVLSEKICLINSNCIVEKNNIKILNEHNVKNFIQNADFVICTMDKPVRVIRRLINNICVQYNKPVIFAGFAEHVGMVGPFVVPRETACLECIDQPANDELFSNVNYAPSFGPLCNIIASIISSEVINYFVKFNPNNLEGCTLMFNMYDYSTEKIEWSKNKNCKMCGDAYDSKGFK